MGRENLGTRNFALAGSYMSPFFAQLLQVAGSKEHSVAPFTLRASALPPNAPAGILANTILHDSILRTG